MLDDQHGEVLFGDGVLGAIPPAALNNVRMKRYQTGGGVRGNRPRFLISELKTTVPYVDRVTNFEAARGGAEAETIEALLDRAPRRFRHRGYAVTAEDYEDLAREASTEVARARCFPLYDLIADPDAKTITAGVVTLVLVPQSEEVAQPPSLDLIDRVRKYLDQRRFPGARLILVGPDYLQLDVRVELVVREIEKVRTVELEVTRSLIRYLHPLRGRVGAGWEFGRMPSRSDLLSYIEKTDGVEYVRSIEIRRDAPAVEARGRFLIYAGEILVTADLER
jgi:predicted phage baseplate assembly protein